MAREIPAFDFWSEKFECAEERSSDDKLVDSVDRNGGKVCLDGENTGDKLGFVEDAGDWEQRNRLKIYRGLYLLTIRDFRGAADSFRDGVSTYTSTELMDYGEFATYTIFSYVFAYDRREMKKDVIKSSDIQEALFDLPLPRELFNSFYQCHYKQFFVLLGETEEFMKKDRYLRPHYSHYVSHVKLRAYKQLLEAYSSLSIKYMADLFGVTEEYIDRELSMYVGCGKLQCSINKVEGIVETTRKDDRSVQYHNIIRLGDKLLNRIQKLSRVINL
ncbi:26S proteasome non-ATPase regulatory subunit 6-like [Octopus sinensis]|uniref:26S proteasome non-ATPase regulatory subunit 6 n=1 Tax=Octopus sinensis TaxID=2607531 RepID=A0A6P7TY08_9MOLL|nr:26S proteasome non-ATPase regulatory subunit 6-like [Octopus sinensis]